MDSYRARWIVPVRSAPIKDGVVAVEGDEIAYVGPASEFSRSSAGTCDLADVIIIPGFINAHTHLELTCYHGRIPSGPLWPWLNRIVELMREGDADETCRRGVINGANESIAAGVTCIGDISRTGLHVESLTDSPIRKVCFVELISGAKRPPHDAASLATAYDLYSRYYRPDALRIGVSPHAPHTVSVPDLKQSAQWAAEKQIPFTMHLLETTEESDWLAVESASIDPTILRSHLPKVLDECGQTVFEWLEAMVGDNLRPLFAHLNYIDDSNYVALRRIGASVAYCPRAHHFFGHAPHPWRELLKAGINVCVGTDSKASNDSLCILDELRFLHRTHPDHPAGELLGMGTIRGAIGLGMDKLIGSLEVGKQADFVAIPLESGGVDEPVNNLMESQETPTGVWIGGQQVYERS